MRIFLGSDHRGFALKEKIKEWMDREEIEYTDMGALVYQQSDDYPEYAFKLAEKVVAEKGLGVLMCGGGGGISIAANKVKGARAVLCSNPKQAAAARSDDDANILCLSADTVDEATNFDILKTFINSLFSSEERHLRRIELIKNYESR